MFEPRKEDAELTANHSPFNPFHRPMSVRRHLSLLFALGAVLLGAGCGNGDNLPFTAETDDGTYQQGQQLKKQGRTGEALAAFLKVIERRGEQASPESHLEAGIIYLQQTKDPIEAIHYFRKYLYLEPNSPKAPLVRQLVETARRELYLAMPGSPANDSGVRVGGQDALERLQRENEAMRAELGRPGSGPAPQFRTSRGPVDIAEKVPVLQSQDTVRRASIAPDFAVPTVVPTLAPSPGLRAPQPGTVALAPPTRPTPGSTVPGRHHTVAAGDTLFAISRKYKVTPEAIAAVNADTLRNGVGSKLNPGMELKIP